MGDTQTILFVTLALTLLLASLVLKKMKQPPVVAYIVVGLLLGKSGFGLVTAQKELMHFGEVGIVLLLFFIGMEMSLEKPIRFWIVPFFGTVIQIAASILLTTAIGYFLGWPFSRILLLGFVISLSSTAVILKLLQDWKELDSRIGQRVIAILLVQDIAVAPMLIAVNHYSGASTSFMTILLQLLGGIISIIILSILFYKKRIEFPILKKLHLDHEGQVFAALSLCFGMALLFSLLHLSAAFGAFIAGLIVSATRETEWAHRSLSSLKVIFMAIFFVAIGMLLDREFLISHWLLILFMLLAMLLLNTVVNACILKALRQSWSDAWYCGALLAQAGEFGYVLLLLGLNNHIINQNGYQIGVSLITLSLLVSPLWAKLVRDKLIVGTPSVFVEANHSNLEKESIK